MIENYDEAVKWLYGLQRLGIKYGLQNIRALMKALGNPHKKFPSVHIAGTNGKGSTGVYIVEMARVAGLKCGLTTSPHLVEMTERIRIGREQISKEDTVDLVNRIIESVESHNAKNPDNEIMPTYFETTIAMAFLYFAEQKVDLAVVEAGLGGRLDSTNVLLPELSIITNIGIEHTAFLGDTVSKITHEKAGIIKKSRPVITAAIQPEAIEVIKKTAAKRNSEISVFRKDFKAYICKKTFTYEDKDIKLIKLKTSLAGKHQVQNASMAIKAALILKDKGFPFSEKAIRKGLQNAYWPGRLELLEGKPDWLIDCAHNPAAARILGKHLWENFKDRKILCVFGAMKDKEYDKILSELDYIVTDWIFTEPNIDRAEDSRKLLNVCKSTNQKMKRKNVKSAINLARRIETDYGLVLVCGSIFLVGDSYELVKKHRPNTGFDF